MKKFNLLKGLMMSLLTLALCFAAFGAVKASAEVTASYNAEKDVIEVHGGSGESTVYYIDLGKSGSQKIAAGKVQTLSLSGNNTTGYSGEIVLDNKDDGLKVAEKKTIYLYYSKDNPENDVDSDDKIKNKSANLTVKGSTATKFTVTLNYACAQSGGETIAFSAADKQGKPISEDSFIFRFSEDGKTFGEWKSSEFFTADELYKAIVNGEGKYTYQFKLMKTGERDSAPVKVKVAKAGKEPKIKVDYLKGTVALKNGFDYHVSSKSAAPTSLSGWLTILPTNKLGTADGEDIYKPTVDVKPSAKPSTAEEKAMFAKSTQKIKSVPVAKLFADAKENDGDEYDADGSIYLYIRKSATAKKPASAITETAIEIKAVAAAPDFTSSISGEYDEKKKTWSFEFSSNSGDVEYLIFDSESAASGEHSEAKWVKLSKGLVTGKSKTKVSKTKTNTLKANATNYVLIRLAGVKDQSLPSETLLTKIRATGEGSGSGANLVWETVE